MHSNKPHLYQQHQYAAIDLGSNSFHMVVVQVVSGSVQVIGKIKQKVRLAAGLNDEMYLSQEAMQRGWRCLESFAERLQDIPLSNIRAVGTATLRLATNADEFLQKAQSILNHDIDVISGEKEAEQIYLGVAYTSANQGNSLVIDIGGASTEVIVGEDTNPFELASLDMGCVTFMEYYFADGLLTKQNFEQAINAAKQNLSTVQSRFTRLEWRQCLGASGTPQAVVEILVAQKICDAIRLDYLLNLQQQCIDCQHIDQLEIEGLQESRRVIFPSGLSILIALFESLGIESMQIAGGALREGLIFGMLDNVQMYNKRLHSLNDLVQRYHIDAAHANRVKKASSMMFHQVEKQIGCQPLEAEALLTAAALLHETGLHIEYKKHHLHAAYILRHTTMVGYTEQQKHYISTLVGNHRQNINPEDFAEYHPEVKTCMLNLCRLLRLASILSIRRKDNILPHFQLSIEQQCWRLAFPENWLTQHPLITAELANEAFLQHRMGWKLEYC